MSRRRGASVLIVALLMIVASASLIEREADAPRRVRVIKVYPHDPQAFTQGLQFVDGFLYEGTGLNGRSEIRKVDLDTGLPLQRRAIDARHFGEGVVVVGRQLIQLTWKSQLGFVYDSATFELLRTFSYEGEGWGITYDGENLVMSDGTAVLRFLHPHTFQESRRLQVREHGVPLGRLNELEFVRGEILANVWQTDRIVRINPKNGDVVGAIDLSGLLDVAEAPDSDVLNGIAYDAARDRLFVTGKLWPKLFEIQFTKDLN